MIFKHAYYNTEFYHRLYRAHNISPSDIRSLDDVKKLPIVSKQDLQKCSLQERFSKKFNIQNCAGARTSGSTGEPFTVYYERRASRYLSALHLRRLLIYGYKPWHTIVVFGPFWANEIPSIRKRRARKGLLNVVNFDYNRLSLVESEEENISFLKALKPEIIWCPPSYLGLLSEYIEEKGIKDVRPNIIISGAEMLDPETRAQVESVFRIKVFDEYGTVDVASRAIAWQCERHLGYHINMDAVHLESIKDGETVSPGEEGHIVVTNLFRYATPMIRYDTADIGVLSGEQCPCGRSFPLLESIKGRSDDYLVLPNGRLLSPLSVFAFLWLPEIHRFKVVQERINKIIIFIEPKPSHNNVSDEVHSRCSQIFGQEVEIEIISRPIEIIKGKKYRVVSSKIRSQKTRFPA